MVFKFGMRAFLGARPVRVWEYWPDGNMSFMTPHYVVSDPDDNEKFRVAACRLAVGVSGDSPSRTASPS